MKSGLGDRLCVIANHDQSARNTVEALRRAAVEYSLRRGAGAEFLFSEDREDGRKKARHAVEGGADTVVAVGGDGTISSIAEALVDTPAALAAIPAGSGNGFARHFGIPMDPLDAFNSLCMGRRTRMDVGYADGRPFFVTCSMAWDAALVPVFQKSPIRGVLSYVVAGIYEFFDYVPQDIEVEIEGQEPMVFRKSLVFTIANLSQYGSGAIIAPGASADDGKLELIAASRTSFPRMVARLPHLFDGTIRELPDICCLQVRSLTVRRQCAGPVQMDGEACEMPLETRIEVRPGAMNVILPSAA